MRFCYNSTLASNIAKSQRISNQRPPDLEISGGVTLVSSTNQESIMRRELTKQMRFCTCSIFVRGEHERETERA